MKKTILLFLLFFSVFPCFKKGQLTIAQLNIACAQYYGSEDMDNVTVCATAPESYSFTIDNGDGSFTTVDCYTPAHDCSEIVSSDCTSYTWGDTSPKDCNGDSYGTAYLSDCGCVGGNTGRSETDCNDCAGVPNGSAYYDDCSTCVGGTTGLTACFPQCNNPAFDANLATITGGATPSIDLLSLPAYGLTYPEYVTADITACYDGTKWVTILTGLHGYYSQQISMRGTTEVTGPSPGNTTSSNFCNQVQDLKSLGVPLDAWYMQKAIKAHENVHATRFLPGIKAAVADMEYVIEQVTVPYTGQTVDQAIAQIKASSAWGYAISDAYHLWKTQTDALVADDHKPGGPCDAAEHTIVDPMINTICTYAASHGWPYCANCH